MSSIITVGPGVAFVAPVGTDPEDHANWLVLGATGPNHLILDETELLPMVWPPGPCTITLTARVRVSWAVYKAFTGRNCPRARRVKTAYHRRRR